MKKNHLYLFVITLAAYLCCYSLISVFSFSAVTSSALVGLIGSFIPRNRFFDFNRARMLIYSSSFCAMTKSELLDENLFHFVLIPFILFVIYLMLEKKFQGLGGKLGSLAFISVLTFLLIGSAISF